MQRGLVISGGAHTLAIGWLLFGGLFQSDPPEVEIANVSVISEAEFAALTQTERSAPPSQPTPIPVPQQPTPPPEPEEQPKPPTPPPEPEPEPQPKPDPQPAPQLSQPDPLPQIPTPPKEAEVQDVPPVLIQPEPEPDLPPDPQPAPAPSSAAVSRSLRPKARAAPRVAPELVTPPEPDTVIDQEVQQAADPDADSPDVAEEDKEATSPEEAAPEIVTEAEDPSGAVSKSLRPQARSPRVAAAAAARAAEAAEDADPDPQDNSQDSPQDTPNLSDALQDELTAALEAELSAGSDADAPAGPPLTRSEIEGLKVAVESCWVVDVGSQAANITVTLGFELDRDGKVLPGTLQLISSQGGGGSAAEAAFQSARRAVLRCQKSGYDLPVEKYDHWKKVEMTFDPSQMRLR